MTFSMKNIKHISFDLDGTLINSIPVMKQAWKETMVELGLAVGFENYKKYIGLKFDDIIKKLGLENITKEISLLYFKKTENLIDQIKLIEGVIETIDWLKKRDITTSIITSKPRKNAEKIIKIHNINVDLLLCGDDFSKGKPNPESGLVIIEKFKLNPLEIVYVGDMLYDLQFAQNLDVNFIHFCIEGENLLPKNLSNKIKTTSRFQEIKKIIFY